MNPQFDTVKSLLNDVVMRDYIITSTKDEDASVLVDFSDTAFSIHAKANGKTAARYLDWHLPKSPDRLATVLTNAMEGLARELK